MYSVTASNKCGLVTDSIHFSGLNCDCFINVPTAFSPNNDNNNDVLYLVGNCMININFFIYDRWGQKVFESHDLTHGWDGTYKGKKLDMAVFVYSLTAESMYDKGTIIKRQGNISLIR
jgi:gliding motility-associated-like protein